jgi:hypothetical protein
MANHTVNNYFLDMHGKTELNSFRDGWPFIHSSSNGVPEWVPLYKERAALL